MAVVPASHRVDLNKVRTLTKRHWRLARENECGPRFSDCANGAIPPVGGAFELEALIDESLPALQYLYCESGDHQALVPMGAAQFLQLMPTALCRPISA